MAEILKKIQKIEIPATKKSWFYHRVVAQQRTVVVRVQKLRTNATVQYAHTVRNFNPKKQIHLLVRK
jgi:hypothetical protein